MSTSGSAEVSGALVPSTEPAKTNSSTQRALETWESEGGSPPEVVSGGVNLARAALAGNAGWRASNTAEKSGQKQETEPSTAAIAGAEEGLSPNATKA